MQGGGEVQKLTLAQAERGCAVCLSSLGHHSLGVVELAGHLLPDWWTLQPEVDSSSLEVLVGGCNLSLEQQATLFQLLGLLSQANEAWRARVHAGRSAQ